jgi:predicted transglutaminase-like cysteine proteinase
MRRQALLSPGALLLLLVSATAGADYSFDTSEDFLAGAAAWPAWAQILERHSTEREAIRRCLREESACSGKLKSLRHVLLRGAALEPDRQLSLVNRYVNKRHYKRELRNHWSTLLEFLQRGGDCEDYAVAKYFLLRELGFPAENMRVLVTWERSARDYHAVLAVRRDNGSTWLLESDNTIVKGSQRRYRFIYALNEEGIWDHAE